MEISSERFIIKMTEQELWNTAFDVRNALYKTLESHWINHQEVWENNEKSRLQRLKVMWTHIGRPDLYDEIYIKAKEIFDAFNKKK